MWYFLDQQYNYMPQKNFPSITVSKFILLMTKWGRHNECLHYFRIKHSHKYLLSEFQSKTITQWPMHVVVNDFENVTILSPHPKLFKSCKFSGRIKTKNYKKSTKIVEWKESVAESGESHKSKQHILTSIFIIM